MINARRGTPEMTELNPLFPELTENEIRELMIRLKGALSPGSFRLLHECTFNCEVSDSGGKNE